MIIVAEICYHQQAIVHRRSIKERSSPWMTIFPSKKGRWWERQFLAPNTLNGAEESKAKLNKTSDGRKLSPWMESHRMEGEISIGGSSLVKNKFFCSSHFSSVALHRFLSRIQYGFFNHVSVCMSHEVIIAVVCLFLRVTVHVHK